MPRVSIGMPVYNGENFFQEALDSVLCQTYQDLELIISDNGSTDATERICRQYAARDRRIRYCRHEVNRGAAWNHARVLELAAGEYFKWAAHDDRIAPDFLEKCVQVLDQDSSVVLVYARTRFINERGEGIGTYEPDTKGFDSPRPHVRFGVRTSRIKPPLPFLKRPLEDAHAIYGLIRTSALRTLPRFGSYGASDQLVLARLALVGRFHRLPEYLFLNRDHPQRSIRAYRGRRLQTVWLDPQNQGKVFFAEWRILREFVSAARESQIDRRERLLCYLEILKYVFWNWPRLVVDVARVCRELLTRRNRPHSPPRPVQTAS